MKMDFFSPRIAACAAAALVAALPFTPETAQSETRYAAPEGQSRNSGRSRSDAWDVQSCFERLSPGDTCVYADGNYGELDFEPTQSGDAGSPITHECESVHGCRFDRILLRDVAYLTVRNIASDTYFHDPSKSFTNPRMGLYNSHHLKFDSIYVRGEPQNCADGNPRSGCAVPSDFNRYNDLIRIGNPNDPSETSWAIEITGKTELIDGNHAVIQLFDDQDSQLCETRESDIWIHGTAETPIKMSSQFHHILAFKGTCRVLVEHVDFGPAGTGRGDLRQPDKGDDDQAGGILHPSRVNEILVRYSNFMMGGSSTSEARNTSHIELGLFGTQVSGACFAHNSHYRPWGTFASIGRLNDVRSVRHAAILNNAVSEPWRMRSVRPGVVTSPYEGFAISRAGKGDFVQVDVDGIVVESGDQPTRFYSGLKGRSRDYSDAVSYMDGIQFGSTTLAADSPIFRQPNRWDFRPRNGSLLVGRAAPIANTTDSGSGRTVPVTRPACFAGSMSGMRRGDDIDVGGEHCTVQRVDLSSGTVHCRESINWSENAPVFYKLRGREMRDIGSTQAGEVPLSDNPADAPRPPLLSLEQQ